MSFDLHLASPETPGLYIPNGWGKFTRAKLPTIGTAGIYLNIACVGDSVMQGYWSSNPKTNSVAARLKARLQAAYTDGGSGFQGIQSSALYLAGQAPSSQVSTAYAALTDYYFALTGTWSLQNSQFGPCAAIRCTTNGATITRKFYGTSLTIYTVPGTTGTGADYTYQIDGGTVYSVTSGTGAAYGLQKTTRFSLSASVEHTVVITIVNDGSKPFDFVGISSTKASGIVVNDHSRGGVQSAAFNNTDSTTYFSGAWCGGPLYPADMCIVALGLNDAKQTGGSEVSGTAYARNLRGYLEKVMNGFGSSQLGNTDLLIVMQHAGKWEPSSPQTYNYDEYCDRARSAKTYGAAFVDMWTLYRNSWQWGVSNSYWGDNTNPGGAGTDPVHLSDVGTTLLYNEINKVVALAA